ncbi:hypothetical protein BGS_0883 [Beggiatoa sp. SS]|nr:hypothetical protein BGS_0883 [Beggiatoa sp. SS]
MRLEYKIYFAIGVQNLFCDWSAKFILRLEYKIYFAKAKIDNDPFFGNAPHNRANRRVRPQIIFLNNQNP